MTYIFSNSKALLLTCLMALVAARAVSATRLGTPTANDYNNVSRNSQVNQMRLQLTDGTVNYYNTSEVGVSIDKSAGTVTVSPKTGTWSDIYSKTVSKIDFFKADSTDCNGEMISHGLTITEAKGWHESAYVKWEPLSNAKSYNVYVKGGKYTDYTKIDAMLVRNYGTYGRADVVGLVSGTYAVKVVAVDASGTEQSTVYGEATGMNVVNYSREGFAHFNYSGVGAYNDDGSLKANAKVIYITSNTAKTVSTTVQTSSNKSETVTGLQAILDAYQKGYDTTPIAFRIIGKISISDLDGTSSSAEGLQIKGKKSYSEMNLTLEGIGDDATVYGFGFLVRNAKSVEFRNFAIMRCLDDAMSLDTDNSNVWIHNMDLFYGKKGSAADQAKGDGTVDIKGDSKYVTVAYNHFWDNGKSSMCGMTSESGENWISYSHNWFDHSDSRHPRIRTMSVHLWNNYFDHNDVYGIGATSGSSVFVDRNYFKVAYRPMMSSKQGTDANGNGTFSGEDGGLIKAYGNIFTEKTSNFSYITWADNSTSFDAYEVSSPTETVPSTVVTKAGGTTYNNFDTNSSLMYSYVADDAADVPAKVTGYYGAGRLNHGDIDFTIPDETWITNGHHQPCPALATLMDSYASSLVSIYGSDSSTSGDSDNGGGGSDNNGNGELTETILCSFDKNGAVCEAAQGIVSTSSNSIKKGATYTLDGTTYSYCIKVDSKQTITVTVDKSVAMTIYFGNTTATTLKVDATKIDISNQILTTTLTAGTHTLTKGDGEAAIALIKLVPTE